MIDHFGINCADLDAAKRFYDQTLAVLGHQRVMDFGVDIAPDQLPAIRGARLQLDEMEDPERADVAAEALLGWLHGASEGAE